MNLESGKSYELIKDIDMSGYTWKMKDFNGYFDGKGHKISNLSYIEENEYDYGTFGLFGQLDGIFKNVHFDNLYINIATNYTLVTYILYSNYYSNAQVENVFFTGNYNAKYDENALNTISFPSGNNIYAVGEFKLNNEDYPNLEKITKETFESEDFRLNTLGWNFKEQELGNYEGLLYTVIGNSYIIVNGYEGENSEVVIPEAINGLPVVGVSDLAFENNKTITSITYPDTLLSIGAATLKGCINLESLTLNETAAVKGDGVLYTLFSGVECEGTYMVSPYGGIEAAVPLGFKYLSYGSENESVDMNCYQVKSLEKVEITGNIKIISSNAFRGCKGLKEIIFPSELKEIGVNAFNNCDSLVKVEIPDSVTLIDNCAFFGCGNLETVIFPKSLKEIGSQAFESANNLKYFTLPNDLEKIGQLAFHNVMLPEYIYIPESVKIIDSHAFTHAKVYCQAEAKPAGWDTNWNNGNDATWGVKHIIEDENFRYVVTNDEAIIINNLSSKENIVIPESVEVDDITYPILRLVNKVFESDEKIKSVTIANDIEIGNDAFHGCINLESVQIDGSVKIEGYAFVGCSSLKTFSAKAITYLGDYAFSECLKLVSIPSLEQVTYLGASAFFQCRKLESVILPNNITEIKAYTFSGCESLEEIILPSNLVKIENSAFQSCHSLKYIIIPEGVTIIEGSAFYECGSLREIILPSTLEYIGTCVFLGCYVLNSLFIPKNVEYIGSAGMNTGIPVYCEADSQPDEWEHDWCIGSVVAWGCKGKFVKDEIVYFFEGNNEELTAIYYVGNEEEVIIPDEVEFNGTMYPVTKIYDFFRDNQTITSLTLSNNITYLPEYAFSGMSKLKTIKLPSELDVIGSYAFYGCQSLEEINIPSKTRLIDAHAFDLCPKLAKVYIPISVERIEYGAFDDFSRQIYCEATSKPASWDSSWTLREDNVIWGYVKTN